MSESIVSVCNISKSFGGRKDVDNLSLSVEPGEVFGLLGHNGAGKSTTIEMILGIKKPDEGSAHILGKDAASHRKEVFEKVGVQLQSSTYQAAIKVGEVCEEFASLYRNPADYHSLLDQFGLLSLIKSPVMKLSGGERQKLSFIRAVIFRPEFIIMDETLSNLDPESERAIVEIIKEIQSERPVTWLMVSHGRDVREELCDIIHYMEKGRITDEVIKG